MAKSRIFRHGDLVDGSGHDLIKPGDSGLWAQLHAREGDAAAGHPADATKVQELGELWSRTESRLLHAASLDAARQTLMVAAHSGGRFTLGDVAGAMSYQLGSDGPCRRIDAAELFDAVPRGKITVGAVLILVQQGRLNARLPFDANTFETIAELM